MRPLLYKLSHLLLWLLLLVVGCVGGPEVNLDPTAKPFEKLSEYNFFKGNLSEMIAVDRVLPFAPVSTLFSDYAEKSRFVWMPDGTSATFSQEDSFAFPPGAVLIKNFYYEHETRQKQIIETRLLVNRRNGWDALTYIWNEAQTEAFLEIVGAEKDLEISLSDGSRAQFQYVIPNKNQCKTCHEVEKKLQPIGPKARNLDFSFEYPGGASNQLDKWVAFGYLDRREPVKKTLVDWSDEKESINDRALSYLDMNCGTCHQPKGVAYVSGLYLTHATSDPSQLGVCKGPVSAGKGSGGLRYDIVPGQPDSSILVHRMITQDPGAMMPELGRKLIHREGVELISAWISEMEGSCE